MNRPMTDEESAAHVRGLEDDFEATMAARYEGAGDPGEPPTGAADEAWDALRRFANEYHDPRLEQALGLLAGVRNDYFGDEVVPDDWFGQAYMGRLVDVIERKGRFSRTGVASRGWYDDGQRIVRVQIRTAREADSYEVTDLADNWEVQA